MIYGYARVSTKGQDKYGNSLQDQQQKLRAAGCQVIYLDSYTGTKMDRPEFSKLMDKLTAGDTLVVTKLDRFARNAAGGATTIQELLKRGVKVNVLNMGVADNTPMGKLMVQIMFAFAEFERDLIVERTNTGKEIAKANNPDWKEGRKRIEIPSIFYHMRELVEAGEQTVADAAAELDISVSTWYRWVRAAA